MAEWLARKLLGSQAKFESAGTSANSTGANPYAIQVMRTMFGINISSHKSRNVREVSVKDFEYIIAMDDNVKEDLRGIWPSINSRLVSWNIKDPYGRGYGAYERSAREIREHVEQLTAYLKENNSRT
jgi:protein-tyrosine-phosphatase